MRVFVTGATGWVGSVVVQELLANGHQVLGLVRSDAGEAAVKAAGADVLRGELADLESLRAGAAASDAVIHTAFIHDFGDMEGAARADLAAIETMGDALTGSGRPLVITSGTALARGKIAKETDDAGEPRPGAFRVASETVAIEHAARNVRTSIVRLPPSVHGDGDHGFVARLVQIARERGESAYIGAGENRWAAVHRLDAATLYRLVVEKGEGGAVYHAVGDEGVPTRRIAEAIGKALGVPVVSKSLEEAPEHFGWLSHFFALDVPASSALTQQRLDWKPTHPSLLEDLAAGMYFSPVSGPS